MIFMASKAHAATAATGIASLAPSGQRAGDQGFCWIFRSIPPGLLASFSSGAAMRPPELARLPLQFADELRKLIGVDEAGINQPEQCPLEGAAAEPLDDAAYC